jgi:hypothetical protein
LKFFKKGLKDFFRKGVAFCRFPSITQICIQLNTEALFLIRFKFRRFTISIFSNCEMGEEHSWWLLSKIVEKRTLHSDQMELQITELPNFAKLKIKKRERGCRRSDRSRPN